MLQHFQILDWHAPGNLRSARTSGRRSCLWRNSLQELAEDLGGAGYNLALVEIVFAAFEIRNQPAGFLDEKRARRHVPRRQTHLPEAIVTAAGNVGQVERRGAGTAHARGQEGYGAEHGEITVELLDLAKRESCADEGFLELQRLGNADAAIVQEGACATACRIQFVAVGVVNDAVRQQALVR